MTMNDCNPPSAQARVHNFPSVHCSHCVIAMPAATRLLGCPLLRGLMSFRRFGRKVTRRVLRASRRFGRRSCNALLSFQRGLPRVTGMVLCEPRGGFTALTLFLAAHKQLHDVVPNRAVSIHHPWITARESSRGNYGCRYTSAALLTAALATGDRDAGRQMRSDKMMRLPPGFLYDYTRQ